MPADLYKSLGLPTKPQVGDAASSNGTTIVVANTNVLEAQTAAPGVIAPDPWDVEDGTAANHANVRPIAVKGLGLYANFYLVGTFGPGDTSPLFFVFGKVKAPQRPATPLRIWPNDDDSGFPANPASGSFWIPLVEPDNPTAVMNFDIPGANLHDDAYPYASSGTHNVSKRRYVYLQGVEEIMVCIAEVGAGFTEGVIMAQVSG